MSIAQNPVMGKMGKSFANVNTYVHRGQNVISAKAFNRRDPNTEAQQNHRNCFKLVSDAWVSLGGYCENGFPLRPQKQTAFNAFVSLNLPGAIDNSGDAPVIDYSALQVSKGSLPGVDNVRASITAQGLTVSGETLVDHAKAQARDMITVLVKRVNKPVKAIRIARGTEADFTVQFELPDIKAAEVEYVYAFANSDDGKKASNSVFVALEP